MSIALLNVSNNQSSGNDAASSTIRNFSIKVLQSDAFRLNETLIEKLRVMLAPSYEDPSRVLLREIAHCTHLYIGKSGAEIICFFLVSRENLEFPDGNQVPSIYMGLSATCQETKNSGLIRRLYSRVMADASIWEKQQGSKIILWATMATPTSYLFSQSMLSNVQPSPNGSFTQEGAKIAHAIRKQHSYGKAANHPFVLNAVAEGTLYSNIERDRIARVLKRKNFNLFERLDIQECRGDRLLIIANTQ